MRKEKKMEDTGIDPVISPVLAARVTNYTNPPKGVEDTGFDPVISPVRAARVTDYTNPPVRGAGIFN